VHGGWQPGVAATAAQREAKALTTKERFSITAQEIDDTADMIGAPSAYELLERRVKTLESQIKVLVELVEWPT
jgi:hypothetical protein